MRTSRAAGPGDGAVFGRSEMICCVWLGRVDCALCREFCESFWNTLENGNFKGYARCFAVLNVLLEFSVPILCFVTANPLPIVTTVLLFIFSVVLGILELPFFCIRCSPCKTVAEVIRIFEIYWIRAIVYLILASTLISVAVHVDENNPATWFFGVVLPIIAILYFVASCKGEKSTLEEMAEKKSQPAPGAGQAPAGVERTAAKSETQSSQAIQELAIDLAADEAVRTCAVDMVAATANVASKNPDLLRDALRAAAGSRV